MRAQKLKVRRVRAVLTASSDGSIFHSNPEILPLVRLLPLLIYQMSCNEKNQDSVPGKSNLFVDFVYISESS